MRNSKIRWTDDTWGAVVGCEKISPGCDRCYAETIAEKWRGGVAFPHGFDPTFKPYKLDQPAKTKKPIRLFTNSMSDMYLATWTREQLDAMHDVMLEVPRHDYLVLTKRPQLMARYFLGGDGRHGIQPDGWLARRGLDEVPPQVWLGTTIEDNRYTFRADWLRRVPVAVRFLSLEPLLEPLPSLNLEGIAQVIVGGESGKGFRPMPHEWARDLLAATRKAGAAFFFKQSAHYFTERGIELDGQLIEEFPFEHPAVHNGVRQLGVWPFAHAPASPSSVKVRK